MDILILGGTRFLGPHTVNAALANGHKVTLFNRGKTNPHLFPELEKLKGDRDGDLTALEGRRWDAVIDTSGFVPRLVGDSTKLLAEHCDLYVFVSSISVYKDFLKNGIDESYPVGTLDDPDVEEVNGETYGPLKAACEAIAEKIMPGRVAIVRPGLIVGPDDNTDRFTYWPVRLDRGGEVLVPQPKSAPVQVIDARDLGAFMIRLIEDGHAGIFNATGPDYLMTMEELVHGCKLVAGKAAEFTWVDPTWLAEQEVGAWMELPLWLPGTEFAGLATVDVRQAVAHGLKFRPPAETISDTLAWANTRPEDYRWRAGLAADKEAKVLKAWKARSKSAAPAEATPTESNGEG
jgi:2'-hydroxyisoflavone reductase